MNGSEKLYRLLEYLNIPVEYLEHPEAPTIEIAKQYWKGHDAKHCKNLQNAEKLSFHPCINTVSPIISKDDFVRFPDYVKNCYEWLELY